MTLENHMISITFTARELTYIIVAMEHYQKDLRESMGEEMGDEYDDILMADHLVKRLVDARKIDSPSENG
ncbi:hypothetical protein B1991_12990 [Rhodanobacter lindaniclasticus]|jgi:hypothetical protein|uniref:Uncharacterized protein n=2 Tax=Rhodanobacter lindaniclasticus TaxID=75310 RepID=A0A4S3KES2_9GAMM|nr:hypothetical protein B1991_12990 [Rhodanobacter lindaniclasticus]